MHKETALGLLGPLASRLLQRRYILGGTKDEYLLAGEPLNDAHSFLEHPNLGEAGSLASVRKFASVLEGHFVKVPIDDPAVSNEMLIEQDPHWSALREVAMAVLEEMGCDLGAWKAGEIA